MDNQKNQHEIMVSESFYFTDEDFEDILVTALEGGIGYWACLDNTETEPPEWGDWSKQPDDMPTSEYAWKILSEGGTLHFLDEEDESAEYYLDMASFMNGIALAIRNKDWDGDMDMLDAALADMIIQYGIFGEVVYG